MKALGREVNVPLSYQLCVADSGHQQKRKSLKTYHVRTVTSIKCSVEKASLFGCLQIT